MAHPLAGADPLTFFGALVWNRGVDRAHLWRTFGLAASVLGRSPFSLAERLYTAARVPKELPAPPIFIIGHWRSGTTHLYNIMAKGDFAYVPPLATGLPWDLLLLGGLFRPLLERALPESRAIDNVPVTPDAPQEDEIALASMSRLSFYHALYFPGRFDRWLDEGLFWKGVPPERITRFDARLHHLYRKLSHQQGGRRLLIKNPVYTVRAAHLANQFPGALFINMVRNPYETFVSMCNFYNKLLPQLALQDYTHVDVEVAVLRVFPEMMRRLRADRERLDPKAMVDLRYEELDRTPLDTVRRAYEALALPDFETNRERFQTYLDGIRSYEKNRFQLAPATIDRINHHWRDDIEQLGYPLRRP